MGFIDQANHRRDEQGGHLRYESFTLATKVGIISLTRGHSPWHVSVRVAGDEPFASKQIDRIEWAAFVVLVGEAFAEMKKRDAGESERPGAGEPTE